MLKLEEVSTCHYQVYYDGAFLGEIYAEVDGFFVFSPELTNGGYWTAEVLRRIACELDDLNKPIQAELDQYFKQSQTTEKSKQL